MSVEIWKPGFALQLFRQIRGLTREQLSKRCNVSVADLRRAECGEINLELRELNEALKVLQFTFGDIEVLYIFTMELSKRTAWIWEI